MHHLKFNFVRCLLYVAALVACMTFVHCHGYMRSVLCKLRCYGGVACCFCVCVCVSLCICVHACMHLCACVCACVCAYFYACTCIACEHVRCSQFGMLMCPKSSVTCPVCCTSMSQGPWRCLVWMCMCLMACPHGLLFSQEACMLHPACMCRIHVFSPVPVYHRLAAAAVPAAVLAAYFLTQARGVD